MNIETNSNLIKKETEKAFLIRIPKSKYEYWIPKKLVKITGNGHILKLYLPKDFKITITKIIGRKVIKRETSRTVTPEQFVNYFNNYYMTNEIIEDLKDE